MHVLQADHHSNQLIRQEEHARVTGVFLVLKPIQLDFDKLLTLEKNSVVFKSILLAIRVRYLPATRYLQTKLMCRFLATVSALSIFLALPPTPPLPFQTVLFSKQSRIMLESTLLVLVYRLCFLASDIKIAELFSLLMMQVELLLLLSFFLCSAY